VDPATAAAGKVDSKIPLLQNENILWHRDFSHGILHRTVMVEEAITNLRCMKYDVAQGKLLAQVYMSSFPELVIMNSRRVSNSLGGGVFITPRLFGVRGLGGLGAYGGPRRGSSKAFGDLSVIDGGKIVMTLAGVEDPQGIRQLVEALKRELGGGRGARSR
jgi:hypothetical protein